MNPLDDRPALILLTMVDDLAPGQGKTLEGGFEQAVIEVSHHPETLGYFCLTSYLLGPDGRRGNVSSFYFFVASAPPTSEHELAVYAVAADLSRRPQFPEVGPRGEISFDPIRQARLTHACNAYLTLLDAHYGILRRAGAN